MEQHITTCLKNSFFLYYPGNQQSVPVLVTHNVSNHAGTCVSETSEER